MAVCVASFLSMNMVAFASGDPYERILDKVNAEYGTDIEYVQVDASEVSLEEYEKVTREVAKEQKNLSDLIAYRVECAEPIGMLLATMETKHITKDVWGYEDKYTITATYDVEGNAVSNPRNIYANDKVLFCSTDSTMVIYIFDIFYEIVICGGYFLLGIFLRHRKERCT